MNKRIKRYWNGNLMPSTLSQIFYANNWSENISYLETVMGNGDIEKLLSRYCAEHLNKHFLYYVKQYLLQHDGEVFDCDDEMLKSWIQTWCKRYFLVENIKDKQISQYFENIEYIRKSLNDEKIFRLVFLAYHNAEEIFSYLYNPLDNFRYRREISKIADDIRIENGEMQPGPQLVEYKKHLYSKRKMSKVYEKDGDFYSVEIGYFFPTYCSEEEIKAEIPGLKKDALEWGFNKLSNMKKYHDLSANYIQIKETVLSSFFKEVRITIGLRDDILALKEEMQNELSRNSEMAENSKCLHELRTCIQEK